MVDDPFHHLAIHSQFPPPPLSPFHLPLHSLRVFDPFGLALALSVGLGKLRTPPRRSTAHADILVDFFLLRHCDDGRVRIVLLSIQSIRALGAHPTDVAVSTSLSTPYYLFYPSPFNLNLFILFNFHFFLMKL